MSDGPYEPFFENLPNIPLSTNDLIELAIRRNVHKNSYFEHLDKAQFKKNARSGLRHYRLRLAKPKEEREGLESTDPEFWRILPVEYVKSGAGKMVPCWYGPTWVSVGPRSPYARLDQAEAEEATPEDSQEVEPIPASLPLHSRIARKPLLLFTMAAFFGAFVMVSAQVVRYTWTHSEEGFYNALKSLISRTETFDDEALLRRAYLEYGNGNLNTAESALVEVIEKTERDKIKGHAYYVLGLIEYAKVYTQRATLSFESAIRIFGSLGDVENRFLAEVELSRITRDAISLPDSLANKEHPRYWKNLYYLHAANAEHALVVRDFPRLLDEAQKALDAAQNSGDVTHLSWAYHGIAIAKAMNGLPARTEMYKARELEARLNDSRLAIFNLACQYLVYQDQEGLPILKNISKGDPLFAVYLKWIGVTDNE